MSKIYVVEIREPKHNERYIWNTLHSVLINKASGDFVDNRPVILTELETENDFGEAICEINKRIEQLKYEKRLNKVYSSETELIDKISQLQSAISILKSLTKP